MSGRRHNRRPWLGWAVVVALIVALAAPRPTTAIELRADTVRTLTGADIVDLPDPDPTLTPAAAAAAFAAGRGASLQGPVVNVPNPLQRHWLSLEIANADESAATWHLATRIPFRPDVAVFLVRANGSVEPLLESGLDTPWAARPVATRLLVSRSFRLAGNEHARLLIRHQSAGPGALPMSLQPSARLVATAASDAAGTGMFYGLSMAALAGLSLFGLAIRNRLTLAYAGLFCLSLLLVAAIEGTAFQHLWPGWPRWNAVAAMPLGLLVCAFGLAVAAGLRDRWPGWRIGCNALALLCLAALALVPLLPLDVLVHGVEAALMLCLLAHAIGHSAALRQLDGLGCLFVAAAIAASAIAAWAIGTLALGLALPDWASDHPQRMIFIILVAVTVVAVPTASFRLRRAHEAALEREVEAARRDAALSSRLLETEKAYSRARDLAAMRRRELATVSHDIRQPLASLRMTLAGLASQQDPTSRKRLADAFDYLERLVRGHELDPAVEDDHAVPVDKPAEGEVEPYPVSLLVETLEQMFREEAEAKGLAFSCRSVDATLSVPILPLMRLLSNLVSNAVKHTAGGSVGIGATATTQAVILEIADTGDGMTAEELAMLRQPGRKGDGSIGSGLGLAIVDEAAAALGVDVAFESPASGGTTVRVTVPARPSPSSRAE
ncbi:MAG: ATP-binding protein [Reyranellaceae bacterium]